MGKSPIRERVDFAIFSHTLWLQKLTWSVVSGVRPEQLRDEEVGAWLESREAVDLLGEDLHGRALALYETVSDIAFEIVEGLGGQVDEDVHQALLKALGDLSSSFTTFLDFAAKHQDGELSHWDARSAGEE